MPCYRLLLQHEQALLERPPVRALVGGLHRLRRAVAHARRAGDALLRRWTRSTVALLVRVHVVSPPTAVVPDLERGARAPSRSQADLHRAATGHLGDPGAGDDGRPLRQPTVLRGHPPGALPETRASTSDARCGSERPLLSRPELDLRHAIGVEKLMWGSDFPKMERIGHMRASGFAIS